ncbi:MAG: PIN domain-containing protein [Bacteroidetes bacterium]|nr:PIN domain-containing protein [Bacteroidota bacterium]
MKKVLLDTNIILDIALKRQPHFHFSVQIFEKIDERKIEGFVTATTITDIYYVSKKETSQEDARAFLLQLVQIVEVNRCWKRNYYSSSTFRSKRF